MLVDTYSSGDPERAGKAYAMNVAGCLAGPLVAGFGLLPFLSERWALVLFSMPWFVVGIGWLIFGRRTGAGARVAVCAMVALACLLVAKGKGYAEWFAKAEVLRDSTATVLATGSGMDKQLLVNGYGMTNLTPITKRMAHLPLAFMNRRPQEALDLCFGMGTTLRALRSWGIPVTVVELVPSVPKLFGYYHSDGPAILRSLQTELVVDDGRRFLARTSRQFDVITIDPPPPVETAGSSLLYSKEFYALAKKRLRPGGILQQWTPAGDREDRSAIAGALGQSFAHVRVFRSPDSLGFHFLASDEPIPQRSAAELVSRMPAPAVSDLTEWDGGIEKQTAAVGEFEALLANELTTDQLIAESPETPALTDDRPINEYYAWRSRHRSGNIP